MTDPLHTSLPEALYALQQEVGELPRDSDNPFFHSKFASFPAIKRLVEPIAKKHGLFVMQTLRTSAAGTDVLRNRLFFNGATVDDEDVTMHLPIVTPQGHGSATSFYRRYAYTTCLGLVSAADDDDGNAASAPQNAPGATVTRPAPTLTHTSPQPVQEDF